MGSRFFFSPPQRMCPLKVLRRSPLVDPRRFSPFREARAPSARQPLHLAVSHAGHPPEEPLRSSNVDRAPGRGVYFVMRTGSTVKANVCLYIYIYTCR